MSAVVVDTDVLSYWFKGDSRVAQFRGYLEDKTAIISFMSVAELERWALQRAWGENRKTALQHYIDQFVVFPYDRDR